MILEALVVVLAWETGANHEASQDDRLDLETPWSLPVKAPHVHNLRTVHSIRYNSLSEVEFKNVSCVVAYDNNV